MKAGGLRSAGSWGIRFLGLERMTQRAPRSLIKEYTSNHIRDHIIIEGIFLKSAILGSLAVSVLKGLCGCFYKLGILVVGVLTIRALPFGVYVRALEFWEAAIYVRLS